MSMTEIPFVRFRRELAGAAGRDADRARPTGTVATI
jgi:hypothetical protein